MILVWRGCGWVKWRIGSERDLRQRPFAVRFLLCSVPPFSPTQTSSKFVLQCTVRVASQRRRLSRSAALQYSHLCPSYRTTSSFYTVPTDDDEWCLPSARGRELKSVSRTSTRVRVLVLVQYWLCKRTEYEVQEHEQQYEVFYTSTLVLSLMRVRWLF